ncbi:hypothetical protein EMCRGX_G032816 [Ephydatia muelleri]
MFVYVVLVASAISCSLGFLTVVFYISWIQSRRLRQRILNHAAPHWNKTGIRQVSVKALRHRARDEPLESLTSAPNIDEQLKKVLGYITRDFVESWFHQHISPDTALVEHVQSAAGTLVAQLTKRLKDMDLVAYFTQMLMEVFLEHLRLFKKATKIEDSRKVAASFFDNEHSDDPWAKVCCNPEAEEAYLRGTVDILLYLLLSEEEHKSAALHQLLRDAMVKQVCLRVFQTVCQPDYLNATIISVTKDNSLIQDTLVAALTHGGSKEELQALQQHLKAEIEHLEKTGLRNEDQQRKSSLERFLSALTSGELLNRPTSLPEILKPFGEEELGPKLLPSITASVERHFENSAKHIVYEINVECHHPQGAAPEERWITTRRYRDFQDLQLTLRNILGGLPTDMSLPAQGLFTKSERNQLSSKLQSFNTFLKKATSESFLSNPQVFGAVFAFLSKDEYTHVNKDSIKVMDAVFAQPFRAITALARTDKTDSTKSSVVVPSPLLRPKTITEEDEDAISLKMMGILKQIIRATFDGKVNRKIKETVDWYTSSEQIASYIEGLTNSLWPGGYAASPMEARSEKAQVCSALLARTKLIGSVPDALMHVIGIENGIYGMIRLFDMFQHEELNKRLIYKLMEGFLDTLFSEYRVKETLRTVRVNVSTGESDLEKTLPT